MTMDKEQQKRWEYIQAEVNKGPGIVERVIGGAMFYGFIMVPVPAIMAGMFAYIFNAEFTIATYTISAIIAGALFGSPK